MIAWQILQAPTQRVRLNLYLLQNYSAQSSHTNLRISFDSARSFLIDGCVELWSLMRAALSTLLEFPKRLAVVLHRYWDSFMFHPLSILFSMRMIDKRTLCMESILNCLEPLTIFWTASLLITMTCCCSSVFASDFILYRSQSTRLLSTRTFNLNPDSHSPLINKRSN
jgi:hypothetical protein